MMSQRGYARHAGVRLSYIQRLIQIGVIKVEADGRIDPVVADQARLQSTDAGRWRREHPTSKKASLEGKRRATPLARLHRCAGCFGLYDTDWRGPIDIGANEEFCSSDCRDLVHAGWTKRQIQAHLRSEFAEGALFSEGALNGPDVFDWVNADGSIKIPGKPC